MTYDAIVVGGGVLGLSTAYHLVKAGAKTLLIDRADEGRATAAGAGIITPETNARDADAGVELGLQAGAYYPQLMANLGEAAARATGYAICGILVVAATEDEVEAFQRARSMILDRQHRRGTPSQADLHDVTPAEAKRLFPPLADVKGALYYRGAGRVDGRQLASVLRQVSEQLGLATLNAGVERLAMTDSCVTGVVTNDETLSATSVIIAGGAWSPAFGDQLGLRLPVEPQRGQIVHLD